MKNIKGVEKPKLVWMFPRVW